MLDNNYKVENDKEFQKVILYDTNISESTKENYRKVVKLFTEVIGKPYYEIVDEIKELQNDKIIANTIIKYDPNQSICNEYILKFIAYFKEKGNKESSIVIRERHIRTVLKKSGVILPSIKLKTKKTHKKKNILTRGDIQYILSKSSVHHKAIISFACATGFRVGDIVKLTIEDFMEATREYHDYYEVDEFIRKAPYDMIGFWKIIPQKTQGIDLECRVCNTPESSNYILESLNERLDFLKRSGLEVEFDDKLFASRNGQYKNGYSSTSLSNMLSHKNKTLENYRKKEILKEYKLKRISHREYKERLENIPRFHAHACRHFFTTTIRAYTTNRDVSLIMEGHSSPYAMDKHYVGMNDEMFGDKVIKETYETVIEYLTFNHEINPEKYFELKNYENKYRKSVEKTRELENKYNELNNLLKEMMSDRRNSVWDKLE